MTITSSHTRKFIHAEKDEPPVCRACYWKAWLRDQNRMLLGAPLGRRSRCRDAEDARAFANDYGYDLVSLLVPGMNCAPDCWTLFIRIQAQTTVDALRNSSGVCPPSRVWRRLAFQWMIHDRRWLLHGGTPAWYLFHFESCRDRAYYRHAQGIGGSVRSFLFDRSFSRKRERPEP